MRWDEGVRGIGQTDNYTSHEFVLALSLGDCTRAENTVMVMVTGAEGELSLGWPASEVG